MLRTVLWIVGACAAVLGALAVSRNLDLGGVRQTESAPAAVEAAAPAAAVVPEAAPAPAPPPPPPPPRPPVDQQVQDDAAATGMTTVEPEPDAPPT